MAVDWTLTNAVRHRHRNRQTDTDRHRHTQTNTQTPTDRQSPTTSTEKTLPQKNTVQIESNWPKSEGQPRSKEVPFTALFTPFSNGVQTAASWPCVSHITIAGPSNKGNTRYTSVRRVSMKNTRKCIYIYIYVTLMIFSSSLQRVFPSCSFEVTTYCCGKNNKTQHIYTKKRVV